MDNVNACEQESWETTDSEEDTSDASDDKLCKEGDSERLSDIDDVEVGSYINDEKEKHYKKIIWDMMNQKYFQEQEAKKAAATSNVTNSKRVNLCCGGCELARTGVQKSGSIFCLKWSFLLSLSLLLIIDKWLQELRHKKATGVKKTQSTTKLVHPASPKKRPSSRINYNALSEVLNDHSPSDKPKKRPRYSELDNNVGEVSIGTQVNDATNETEDKENDWEDDANYSHYNNEEEEYEFYEDDEFF